jgi:hypothetical protein
MACGYPNELIAVRNIRRYSSTVRLVSTQKISLYSCSSQISFRKAFAIICTFEKEHLCHQAASDCYLLLYKEATSLNVSVLLH